MINRRAFFLSASACVLFASSVAAQTASDGQSDAAWQLKPFMLEDVNGAVVDDTTLHGKFVLIFFGYTSCPDVCPTTLSVISAALKALDADADKVLPLFVSLDPDRDTRKVLSDYTAAIDPRIVALRGPKPYIDAMTANFGVTYRFVTPDPAKPKDYAVDHTATIFFLGPDGTLIKTFGHDVAPALMAGDIRRAIKAAPKQ